MKSSPIFAPLLVFRLALAGLLAGAAHQFHWAYLRFLDSQIVFVVSRLAGVKVERIAFDTLGFQGGFIQILVSCTFAEVMLGIQPLLWRTDQSGLRNVMRAAASVSSLFIGNILRIEMAQLLFGLGVPWVLAHDIPLGAIYFGLCVAVWKSQTWQASPILASPSLQPGLPLAISGTAAEPAADG
jgi:hypothetical protein